MDPGTGSSPHQQLTSGKDTGSARCIERCTPGAGGGLRETTGGNTDTAPAGLPHSGDRRGGREQPRRSRVGLVLPDGPGAVSETGRDTRETGVVTPLETPPPQPGWMGAGSGRVPAPIRAGNSCPGLHSLGWEVTVNACGVAVAMPQG